VQATTAGAAQTGAEVLRAARTLAAELEERRRSTTADAARLAATEGEAARVVERAGAMAEEAMQWGDTREPQSLADDESDLRQSLPDHAPGARVLVVDDNNDMLGYLTRLLSSHWSVETAPNGSEALALARRTAPDLVLADVMMPGLDGFGLLRELRHDPDLSATPVVLVTARAGEQTAIEGLLAGANDYIVKPFSARELVARVGAQLELSRTRRAADERLRRVLETDNVGVLYFDYAGTVVGANQVFLGMSGYTRAEIERGELTWRRMTPPEWTAISEQQMQRLSGTGRIGPYEKEYVFADGTRRWMLFAGRDLGDGTIGEFCVDITDLKTAETPQNA
jgi:PAS domain S-box-containing protein